MTINDKHNSLLQRNYGDVIHVVKVEDTTSVRGIFGEWLHNVADVRVKCFFWKKTTQIENYFNFITNAQLFIRFHYFFKNNLPFLHRVIFKLYGLWLIYIHRCGFRFWTQFKSYSCSWQLGLESESDSVQCEKFYVLQCSHLVCSLNRNQNR